MRLDAALSRFGYCSRSEARAWLKAGRVVVGGAAGRLPSEKVNVHDILVDGEPIEGVDGILAILHKPAGYVCSRDASEGKTIYELLPARWMRRNPSVTTIGRLDKDATGVLLVTDLGQLVHRWTSPRNKVSKVYQVEVEGKLSEEIVEVFESGTLMLEGESEPCLPAKVELISAREARLEIVEGRYHQVKRMFASQGCPVVKLHRSRFGEHTLGDLEPGQWRIIPMMKPPDTD